MESPIGYVYLITCNVNGKTYIGLRHYKLDEGKGWGYYLGSGSLIRAAVKKYGPEKFTKIKLKNAYSEEELQRLEWECIRDAKSNGKAEYNLYTGLGAGGDTFSRMTPEKQIAVNRKRAATLRKRVSEGVLFCGDFQGFGEGFRVFSKKSDISVIDLYRNSLSVGRVASYFGVPRSWITKILNKAGVHIIHINERDGEDLRLLRNYQEISTKLKQLILKNGETSLERHDRLIKRIDSIIEMRQTSLREEVERTFNVTHTWFNGFLKSHGISSKNELSPKYELCEVCSHD